MGSGKWAAATCCTFVTALAKAKAKSSYSPIRTTPATGIPIDCWPCCGMPVVDSCRGWVRKVNRLSCCLSWSCCCLNLFLLLSMLPGSRCLKCLRDFVNAPASPQRLLNRFQLNRVKNIHGTCQQMRMRA